MWEIIVAKVLFPFLGMIITAAVTTVLHKYGKKIGIDVQDSIVKEAVLYAEEKALAFYKSSNAKLPSSEKLDTAVQYVWDHIPETKKDAYQEKLQAKIEAKVYEVLHYTDVSQAPGSAAVNRD